MGISVHQYEEMQARLNRNKLREAPAPMPADAPDCEGDLHETIVKECQRRGWLVFHGSMAHRTHRTIGEPDLIIPADSGVTFYIELKSRTGKPTPEQNAVSAYLFHHEHRHAFIRSVSEFLSFVDPQPHRHD